MPVWPDAPPLEQGRRVLVLRPESGLEPRVLVLLPGSGWGRLVWELRPESVLERRVLAPHPRTEADP